MHFPNVHRRQFLVTSAAATLGAMTSNDLDAAPTKPAIPIVDTHQHLRDVEQKSLQWLPADNSLAAKQMEDYIAAVDGMNVVQSIYMEVNLPVEQQDAEIEHVTRLCEAKQYPLVAAIVGGHPAEPGFRDYVAQHRDNPWIRGVRQTLHGATTPQGLCLQDAFVDGMHALAEVGWSYDLCMRSTELADGAKLASLCPDTRFVLDHCGNASVLSEDLSQWRRDIAAVAAQPNTIGKISGVIASGAGGRWSRQNLAPIINHSLDVFGPDRVVFGGDWPVCTRAASLAEWITTLREIVATRPIDEQEKLFHKNAQAFFRLA